MFAIVQDENRKLKLRVEELRDPTNVAKIYDQTDILTEKIREKEKSNKVLRIEFKKKTMVISLIDVIGC
jgi:hypothetical protein